MPARAEQEWEGPVRDVGRAADPVGAVLAAYDRGERIALRTSGTTARPRSVVRSAASWVDSFPAVSGLTGIGPGSRLWVPGPLTATMNLFAAVHARYVAAEVSDSPAGATHACLTPAALARCLGAVDLRGMHVIVAGDRLGRGLTERASRAGARVSHYYGAAELSFVAWGSAEDDLRPFPGVQVQIREGLIWVRSPYVSQGYVGEPGPLRVAGDGFATVGDGGRLTADVLTVTGRGNTAVVTAGATVLVDDVERALRDSCGGELVVIGIPHQRLGQVVGAVLTARSALNTVQAQARNLLPPSARPRLWFHLPVLPLTPAGKVDRAAIGALVASGSLLPVASGGEQAPAERAEVERP